MAKIYKKNINIKNTPLAKGSTKIIIPDISKLKRLGFKPKLNLEKGLKMAINIS